MSAFALGVLAFGALAVLAALALAAFADATGRPSFELRLVGIQLVGFLRDGASTSTTFGPGVTLLALGGGLLNAAGAAVLARLGRRRR